MPEEEEKENLNTDPEDFFQQHHPDVLEAMARPQGMETMPGDWQPHYQSPAINVNLGEVANRAALPPDPRSPGVPGVPVQPTTVSEGSINVSQARRGGGGFDSFTGGDTGRQSRSNLPINDQVSQQKRMQGGNIAPNPNPNPNSGPNPNQPQAPAAAPAKSASGGFFENDNRQRQPVEPTAQDAFFNEPIQSPQSHTQSQAQSQSLAETIAPYIQAQMNPATQGQIGNAGYEEPYAESDIQPAPMHPQGAAFGGNLPNQAHSLAESLDQARGTASSRPPLVGKPNLDVYQARGAQQQPTDSVRSTITNQPAAAPIQHSDQNQPQDYDDSEEEADDDIESDAKKANFKRFEKLVQDPDTQALAQLLLLQAKDVAMNPKEFYSKSIEPGNFIEPALFLIACSVIGGLLSGFSHLSLFYTIKFIFISVVFTAVATFMIWKLFTLYGSAKSLEENFQVMAYSQVTLVILGLQSGILSIIIGVAVFGYTLYLQMLGMEALHGMPRNKVLVILGGVAFFFAVIGNSLPLKP